MEQHLQLRDFVEEILKRDLETIRAELRTEVAWRDGSIKALSERLQAVKDTATALLPELMRRLEELNGAAQRRVDQEAVDRQQYVQAAEFKESRNENQTWRNQVEKELRSFPTIADVRQWVAVLQSKVDELERAQILMAKGLAITSGERQAQTTGQQERAWILPLAITIGVNLLVFLLNWLRTK